MKKIKIKGEKMTAQRKFVKNDKTIHKNKIHRHTGKKTPFRKFGIINRGIFFRTQICFLTLTVYDTPIICALVTN